MDLTGKRCRAARARADAHPEPIICRARDRHNFSGKRCDLLELEAAVVASEELLVEREINTLRRVRTVRDEGDAHECALVRSGVGRPAPNVAPVALMPFCHGLPPAMPTSSKLFSSITRIVRLAPFARRLPRTFSMSTASPLAKQCSGAVMTTPCPLAATCAAVGFVANTIGTSCVE